MLTRNGRPKRRADLTLAERERVLGADGDLPSGFEELYEPVRGFRNYMHPERKLVVKVVDTFGNDTMTIVEVTI